MIQKEDAGQGFGDGIRKKPRNFMRLSLGCKIFVYIRLDRSKSKKGRVKERGLKIDKNKIIKKGKNNEKQEIQFSPKVYVLLLFVCWICFGVYQYSIRVHQT